MSVGAGNFSPFHPEFLPEVKTERYKVIPKLLRVVTTSPQQIPLYTRHNQLQLSFRGCWTAPHCCKYWCWDWWLVGLCLHWTGLTSDSVVPVIYQLSHCTALTALLACWTALWCAGGGSSGSTNLSLPLSSHWLFSILTSELHTIFHILFWKTSHPLCL